MITGDDQGRPATAAAAAAAAPAAAPLPIDALDLRRFLDWRHDQPQRLLGPHPAADGRSTTVRAFLPHAAAVSLRVLAPLPVELPMQRIHPDGLYAAVVEQPADGLAYAFLIDDGDGRRRLSHDSYARLVTPFGDADARRFAAGRHARLPDCLGARPQTLDGVHGVRFAVWAPAAERVSVVGSFNRWDGRCHPMRRLPAAGVFALFVADAKEGDYYKFEIRTADGACFLKADPFALRSEGPPGAASIVDDPDWGYPWLDGRWLGEGRAAAAAAAVAVARLGLDGRIQAEPPPAPGAAGQGPATDPAAAAPPAAGAPLPFATLAERVRAIAEAGYSHLALMPSATEGWGSPGLFAPGESLGGPEALEELIDTCHAHRLAVVWRLPGPVLPAWASELPWFDGSRLFESEPAAAATAAAGVAPATTAAAPAAADQPCFAIDRGEVASLLVSLAAFWVERFHIDAIAVAPSMLPLVDTLRAVLPAPMAAVAVLVDAPPGPLPAAADLDRLARGMHADPFAVLGPHPGPDGLTIRALLPDAEQAHVRFAAWPHLIFRLAAAAAGGLFQATLPAAAASAYRLDVKEPGRPPQRHADPYAAAEFLVSPFDQHLFNSGNHYRIYDRLGAHGRTVGGEAGTGFAVWAPNAAGVSVVGPFNGWDGRRHQMKRHGVSGLWELFIPGLGEGALYKFEIRAPNGHRYLKADPYAFATEVPPANASVVYEPQRRYAWGDAAWMAARPGRDSWAEPVAIYEVHLGSWRRGADNRHLSYRELAARLVEHVQALGFTHIELLPIAEHPFEPSWGYQVTSYYAPTARHGRPEELMYLVDHCHRHGIGVILDWVPGHFPKDAFALAWFDGSHLYEHADPRQGEHRDWGTLIFNYGRHEVENFLIANALFWLEHYHFDGLRVDAVASMLYLDYSRPAGAWIPNRYGGRENLEAIEFLRHTNAVVHERFPGVMMIAEESTSWPKVSRPTNEGGLGFGFKWNMGWMHDTLGYFATPAEERPQHHGKLTFSIVYAFNENFVLSLSHDEVVHLKGALWTKMAGVEDWEKLANLRLLYLYMYAHPGKKLLFMGGEFGQRSEWNHATQLDWGLLDDDDRHRRLAACFAALNRLYRAEPAMFEADFRAAGFEWLEVDNGAESILAFQRRATDPRDALVFVFNFSAVSRPAHRLGVPYPVAYEVLFDSNDEALGGFGPGRQGEIVAPERHWCHGWPTSLRLRLPALSGLVLKPAPPRLRPLAGAGAGGR